MGRRAVTAGASLPKQFLRVRGRPVIEWALASIVEAGCEPVVVVVPEDVLSRATDLFALPEGALLVGGGKDRQQSVRAGLGRVDSEHVVIHDSARPLASAALIRRVVDAIGPAAGAVAGLPVEETLKEVVGAEVVRTVDRARLWQVQTPQAFVTEELKIVHERAALEGLSATDDAQLVESYGGSVVAVRGDRRNVKITYPEDIAVVADLLGDLA